MASTCDYVLTASPTSPTSRPRLTAFHATNHATPALAPSRVTRLPSPPGAMRAPVNPAHTSTMSSSMLSAWTTPKPSWPPPAPSIADAGLRKRGRARRVQEAERSRRLGTHRAIRVSRLSNTAQLTVEQRELLD